MYVPLSFFSLNGFTARRRLGGASDQALARPFTEGRLASRSGTLDYTANNRCRKPGYPARWRLVRCLLRRLPAGIGLLPEKCVHNRDFAQIRRPHPILSSFPCRLDRTTAEILEVLRPERTLLQLITLPELVAIATRTGSGNRPS